MLTFGAVLSSLTTREVEAVFPALSTACPATVCPAVSVFTTIGAVHVSIPLRTSVQAKLTVALALFHPAAFGGGVALDEITGLVLSILTVASALELNPARFTAVPTTPWLA